MDREEVLRLAKLARIDISDAEAESLSSEFEAILKYVAEVKEVKEVKEDARENGWGEVNVLREDKDPHQSGIYTEDIMKNAPGSKGGYIKVKKIL